MVYTLKNGYLMLDKIEKLDLLIDDGKIALIDEDINEGEIIDCSGLLIAPGFIDPHCHLREPGFTDSETIKTGSMAACHGGYTQVFAMPNTNPIISTKEDVDNLNEIIKRDSLIGIYPLASITKDEKSQELTDFDSLDVIGFSDDGKPVLSSKLMYEAMIKAHDKAIICHCEDLDLVDEGIFNDCEFTRENNYRVNLDISESTMVARDLVIAMKTKAHYHVCHMATKESLELIKFYKKRGCNVTVEVTPHHLLLNDSMLKDDPNYKMNPPIRSQEDQEALILGLVNGDIDMISTDHAPHSENKKNKPLAEAAFGIVGLETAFSLLYTKLVKTGILPLVRLLNLMSLNVAKAFHIRDNEIIVGNHANLVILDLDNEYTIDKNKFLSKGRNTPFDGEKCYGIVKKTIYKGAIVYES